MNPYPYPMNMSYTVDLAEGMYYPVRIVFGWAQIAANFYALVAVPGGTIILDSNTSPSPYLVQFSCDGVEAPLFPDFGQET